MGNLTHTVRGDIANFRSAARVPIESLKFHFLPKQDLHGYGKPWPGGGGKNLLDVASSTPQYASYVLSEGAISINAVSGGNGSFQWFDQSFPAGTYTMSAKYSGSVSGVRFLCTEALTNWTWNDYYNGYFSSTNNTITFTTSETFLVGVVFLTLADHAGESGTIYDIQLESASAATTYEPYENICPIEGWTGLNGRRSGKNLLNVDGADQYSAIEKVNGKFVNTLTDTRDQVQIYFEGYNITGNQTTLLGQFGTVTGITSPGVVSKTISITSQYENMTHLSIKHNGKKRDFRVYFPIKLPIGAVLKCSVEVFSVDVTTVGGFSMGNIQLEVGSIESEYEPYSGEQIPITFPSNGKNIVDWPIPNNFSVDVDLYNGWTYGWINVPIFVDRSNYGKRLVYSALINNTNGTREASLHVWIKDKNGSYVSSGIMSESVAIGVSKRVSAIINITNDRYYEIYCGLTMGRGCVINEPMAEYADAPTAYEPYSSDNTFYGGYIDPVAGKLVAEYKIDGPNSGTWTIGSSRSYQWSHTKGQSSTTSFKKNICTHWINNKKNYYEQESVVGINENGALCIGKDFFTAAGFDYDNLTSSQISEYLSQQENNGTPFRVCYPLLVPIEYPIAPTDLKAFLDHNNFWSNTNDIAEVTYQIHDSNMIQQAKKNIMSENATHYKKVLWNNIVNGDVNSTDWKVYSSSVVSATFNSGVADCEVIDTTKVRYSAGIVTSNYPNVLQSNTYYASYEVKPEYFGKFGIEFASGQQLDGSSIPCLPNVWRRRSFLKNGRNNASGAMYIPFPAGYPSNITPRFQVRLPLYIDLTQMFGSGNEPQTAREFEALCKFNNVSLEEVHNKDVAGTEIVWTIPKRKKVIWNQIAAYPTLNDYKPYDDANTLTEENGELVITYGAKSNDYHNCISTKKTTNYYQNHKYYVKQDFCPSWNSTRIGVSICNYASVLYPQATANEYTSVSYILEKLTANNDHNILLAYPYNENALSIGDSCRVKNIILVDLTLMFGAGSEPTTAQEFEAMCEKNCIDLSQFQAQDKTGTEELWII